MEGKEPPEKAEYVGTGPLYPGAYKAAQPWVAVERPRRRDNRPKGWVRNRPGERFEGAKPKSEPFVPSWRKPPDREFLVAQTKTTEDKKGEPSGATSSGYERDSAGRLSPAAGVAPAAGGAARQGQQQPESLRVEIGSQWNDRVSWSSELAYRRKEERPMKFWGVGKKAWEQANSSNKE